MRRSITFVALISLIGGVGPWLTAPPVAAAIGDVTTFADPAGTASTDGPFAIAAGPDDNLWFTSRPADRIGRVLTGRCAGEVANVVMALGEQPPAAADVVVGSAGQDDITTLGGTDTICAMGGNDMIRSGSDNDHVIAGEGSDTVLGGLGADRLEGGVGNDTIDATTGND